MFWGFFFLHPRFQLALLAGARVFITSSSDAKLAHIRTLLSPLTPVPDRAIHTHNYKSDPDWDTKLVELTNGVGAECIVEVGGPGTIEKSFGAVRRGGWIST